MVENTTLACLLFPFPIFSLSLLPFASFPPLAALSKLLLHLYLTGLPVFILTLLDEVETFVAPIPQTFRGCPAAVEQEGTDAILYDGAEAEFVFVSGDLGGY